MPSAFCLLQVRSIQGGAEAVPRRALVRLGVDLARAAEHFLAFAAGGEAAAAIHLVRDVPRIEPAAEVRRLLAEKGMEVDEAIIEKTRASLGS